MLYEIKAYKQSVTYDKCWIEIEASSPEEALTLVKENPSEYQIIDSKCVDMSEDEFVDMDEWEITDGN